MNLKTFDKPSITVFQLVSARLLLLMTGIGMLLSFTGQKASAQELIFSINTKDEARHALTLINEAHAISRSSRDSALSLLYEALRISRKTHFSNGIGYALVGIGIYLNDKRQYQQSKIALYEALPYCLATFDNRYRKLLPQLYNGLGAVYTNQGNNDSAAYFYYLALTVINQNQNNPGQEISIYSNLGGTLSNLDQGSQALYYLRKAMALARETKDSAGLGQAYHNMGLAYQRLNNQDSALYYYHRSLNIRLAIKDIEGAQMTCYMIGRTWLIVDSIGKAKYYFNAAVKMGKKQAENFSPLLQGLGAVYLYLKDYSKAIPYYQKAMEVCNRQGILRDKLTIYASLAKIYNQTGKNSLAFKYQKAYSDLKDTLSATEKIKTINQLEVKYRTAEKDKQLARQQFLFARKESKLREKNLWMGGVAVSSMLLLLLIIGRYRSKQKLQSAQLHNLAHQQEIERLNSRMQGEELERTRIAQELHDGVSVLLSAVKMTYTAIGKENKGLAQSETYQEVMRLINQTGQEVRSISHNLVPELLIQQSLPAAIQAFCELMQKGHHLNIELQVYGAVTTLNTELNYVIYRIIQELIHNIIKHAQATEVLVQFTLHGKVLQLTVEDNGIGFETEKPPAAGMGLYNLQKRVEQLNGTLSVNTHPDVGTTVEIEILLPENKSQETENAY